ncbi:hypothetical protein IV417_10010 [Alphaproteobacteria bacterium KMM 3653]|uniref:Uncharacterized protein n=1 Tax=Harenicola maris TaxID=2841044 RepID=A0AAP2CNK2_9RHOB|nr:hypothetical protein [Harenicola maris]
MLTILADALMTATRGNGGKPQHDAWASKKGPRWRGHPAADPYKFNPYRDLW